MPRLFGLAGVIALCVGCATIQQVKEKQATSTARVIAAPVDSVMASAQAVLPEFHLIAVGTYPDAGVIDARGDWDSDEEGAVVEITVKPQGAGTLLEVEAGASKFDTSERKLALARAVADRIAQQVAGTPAGP